MGDRLIVPHGLQHGCADRLRYFRHGVPPVRLLCRECAGLCAFVHPALEHGRPHQIPERDNHAGLPGAAPVIYRHGIDVGGRIALDDHLDDAVAVARAAATHTPGPALHQLNSHDAARPGHVLHAHRGAECPKPEVFIGHQSASPRICNLSLSSSTVPCPLITVRTTHIGPRQASVLKRTALPLAQPVPQPAARMVKYGTLVAGLMGEQSVLMLPVAITPSCCSTTLKLVALVNTSAHLPAMAPMLVISIG